MTDFRMPHPGGPYRGEMPENGCGFDECWQGICRHVKPCPRHDGLKCWACNQPATKNCDHTFTQFVCGENYCKDHPHTRMHR